MTKGATKLAGIGAGIVAFFGGRWLLRKFSSRTVVSPASKGGR